MKGLLPGRGDSIHLGGFHVEEPAVKHTGPGANRPPLLPRDLDPLQDSGPQRVCL